MIGEGWVQAGVGWTFKLGWVTNSDLKPTLAERVKIHGINDQERTINILLCRRIWTE